MSFLDDIFNKEQISTFDLYKNLKVRHATLIQLIKKHKKHFDRIRHVEFKTSKTGGRPAPYCFLTTEQITFLIMLMKNSTYIVALKDQITSEYIKYSKHT